MSRLTTRGVAVAVAVVLAASGAREAVAQARGGRGGSPVPQVVSPEVSSDRTIAFRVYAPQADAVRLSAGDIPGVGQNAQLRRGENGVWEVTLGPVDPGTASVAAPVTARTCAAATRAVPICSARRSCSTIRPANSSSQSCSVAPARCRQSP